MNQGRIWCVVKPTVGLPLMLGSVAVTALAVHYAVLTNTTWFSAYWNGKAGKSAKANIEETVAPLASLTPKSMSGYTVSVTPVVADKGGTSFMVTFSPSGQTQAADKTAPVDKMSLATLAPTDTK